MTFDLDAAAATFAERFAPWVQDLSLSFEAAGPDGVTVRMPFSPSLCRDGGVVCGQAFMALADTATVFGLWASIGEPKPCTTVDLAIQMMRPISGVDVLATTTVKRAGRTLAFVEAVLCADGDERPAVNAISTIAFL